MVADMMVVLVNARRVNPPDSAIVRDTYALEQILLNAHRGLGVKGLNSPKVLKEKFGWSRTRAPGGPQIKLKNVSQASSASAGGRPAPDGHAPLAPSPLVQVRLIGI
jgi:hypothetical protein